MSREGADHVGIAGDPFAQEDRADWAARRHAFLKDPLGDRVQAWIGAFALAMQPLTPLTAFIGLLILLVHSVLRLHATAGCYRTIFRGGLFSAWIAVLAWIGLSIVWSPDPWTGLDDFRKIRVVFLILGLWPVVHHARLLIVGLSAGCAINALVQLAMLTGLVASPHQSPSLDVLFTGGLSKHPGMTALFAAVSSVLLLGLVLRRGLAIWLFVPLFLGSAANVLFAGNRTVFLSVPVAVVFLIGMVLRRRGFRRRYVLLLLASVTIVAIGVTALAPGASVGDRLGSLRREVVAAASDANYNSSGGYRFLWWRESLSIGSASPIAGHGAGSSRTEYAEHLQSLDIENLKPNAYTGDPHSTFVLAWVEQGAIGLILWCVFFAVAFRNALRQVARDPGWIGLPAAWLLFVAFGVTSSITMSTYTMSMGAILVVLTIPRSSVDPTRSPTPDAEASSAS